MSGIESILEQMQGYVSNPTKAVALHREKTGKGAVGCIAPYTPEVIVHAAGLLPIGLWGGHVELRKARAVLPSFCCSIMQSIKELELNGRYDILTAVMCPSLCDTLKGIGQKWSNTHVPMIQFVHPQNRKLPAAKAFLAKEYESVRTRLEKVIGYSISDEALEASIAVYNTHNAAMRRFAEDAGKHPELIDPKTRHLVFKSAFFMRKEDHTQLVSQLCDELEKAPTAPWAGPKLVLSGIQAEPDEILDVLADLHVAVVADDLAQESRQYRVDIPGDGTPMERLSAQWQNMYGCSLAYEKEKSRLPMLEQLYRDHGADGVVIAMMKFCDPEEFDFPLIKKYLEEKKIPLLQVEIDQQMESTEQFRTRMQSFCEILAQK